MKIVVVGARGRTGAAVTRQLISAGHDVTGSVRSSSQCEEVSAMGAEPFVFDLEDDRTGLYERLVEGAHAVVYAAGSGWGASAETVRWVDGEAIIKVIDASVRAGVRRFVLVSAYRTDEDFGGEAVVKLLRAKRAADAHLRQQKIGWTILRPDALGEGSPSGQVTMSVRVGRRTVLDREDLAATIAELLEQDALRHVQVEIVGGSTPIKEAVAGLSQV